MFLKNDDPIIACSSGISGNSAIALLRISHHDNLNFLDPFFSKKISSAKKREATFSKLYDENQQLLDEIVYTFFPAPHSYNGENILELGVHGNQLNVQRILDFFLRNGLRLAENGEFTYRALKNQKMTLDQVEGLDVLLNSQSAFGLSQGLSMLSGALHDEYLLLREEFIKLKAGLELGIDFLEDIGEEGFDQNFKKSFDTFYQHIKKLYSRTLHGKNDLLNPTVVFIGAPNAGKSTLFNILLDNDRAIVSPVEGTTRDFLSEYIMVGENSFRLVDTAGLRSDAGEIEGQGIERGLEIYQKAFFKIYVYALGGGKDFVIPEECDLIIFTHFDTKEGKRAFESLVSLIERPFLLSGPIGADFSGPIEPVLSDFESDFHRYISGPIGPGVEKKLASLWSTFNSISGGSMGAKDKNGPIEPADFLFNINSLGGLLKAKFLPLTEQDPMLVPRQRAQIGDIYQKTELFGQLCRNMDDIAILASELETIGVSVDELLGIIRPDEVLNSIFSNFCIGK